MCVLAGWDVYMDCGNQWIRVHTCGHYIATCVISVWPLQVVCIKEYPRQLTPWGQSQYIWNMWQCEEIRYERELKHYKIILCLVVKQSFSCSTTVPSWEKGWSSFAVAIEMKNSLGVFLCFYLLPCWLDLSSRLQKSFILNGSSQTPEQSNFREGCDAVG